MNEIEENNKPVSLKFIIEKHRRAFLNNDVKNIGIQINYNLLFNRLAADNEFRKFGRILAL